MTRLVRRTVAVAFGLALVTLAAGCEDEKPAKPKVQARDTLKKTTQVVLDLKPELAKGDMLQTERRTPPNTSTSWPTSYRTTQGWQPWPR